MNKQAYYLVYNDDGSYAGVCEGASRSTDTSFMKLFGSTLMDADNRHYIRISKRTYQRIRKIEKI